MTDYLPLVRKIAERVSMPPGLLWACAKVESQFNPRATRYESHKDDTSIGLMQMLTRTAQDRSWLDPMGIPPVDGERLLDPEVNLLYGSSYLKYQYKRFPEIVGGKDWPEERWRFAVASFNAGRAHINDALAAARHALGASISDKGEALWKRWWFASSFLGVATKQSAKSAQSNRYHVAKCWTAWHEYKREHESEPCASTVTDKIRDSLVSNAG